MPETSRWEVERLIGLLRNAADLPGSVKSVCDLIECLALTKSIKALEPLLPYIWKTTGLGPNPDRSKGVYFADQPEKSGGILSILRRPQEHRPSATRAPAERAVHQLATAY